jgi:hypothetical protein
MGGEGKGGEDNFLIIFMFGSKEGKGGGRFLIINVFGSRREGRDDKTKLPFYPYNLIRVS